MSHQGICKHTNIDDVNNKNHHDQFVPLSFDTWTIPYFNINSTHIIRVPGGNPYILQSSFSFFQKLFLLCNFWRGPGIQLLFFLIIKAFRTVYITKGSLKYLTFFWLWFWCLPCHFSLKSQENVIFRTKWKGNVLNQHKSLLLNYNDKKSTRTSQITWKTKNSLNIVHKFTPLEWPRLTGTPSCWPHFSYLCVISGMPASLDFYVYSR